MRMSLIPALAITMAGLATGPAQAVDVGVSVHVSQPGVYGRIDIGRFPQPQVYVGQPIIVQPPHVVVRPLQPVYLWVPPGHRKNWRKHCAGYGACGVPVAFVRDDWYEREVRPHGKGNGGYDTKRHGKGHDKGHGKGKRDRDDD